VTKTVTKILDILKERNLLLNRGNSDQSADTSEKKPLDNRMRIVKELVDTERKYVQDLEILQEYMRCLEREEVVSKDLIHNLFLNLNQLVDFQRRFLIRVETQNDMPPEQQDWGNLFVQYVSTQAPFNLTAV
jgi:cell division control protein 24